LLVQKVTLEQGVAPSVRVTVEALGEMTVVKAGWTNEEEDA